MIYLYEPKLPKKYERLIALITALLGVALFAVSQIPALPIPALYQFLGLVSLTASIVLVSRYLMRRYVYSIEMRTDGGEDAPPDFVVVEHYGRRVSTVCRVSVAEIEEILPLTRENRRQAATLQRGRFFYDYTADLFSANRYLVSVQSGDHLFVARILADEALLRYLQMQ